MDPRGFFISQDYENYTERDHSTWATLYQRIHPRWERYANRNFLEGLSKLRLDPQRVPRLEQVNEFLKPLTGFEAKAVSGYIPAYLFFDCLSRREFPTTIRVRPMEELDYLPEPDIFHDICGHVPMHTDRSFAEALVRFGALARAAAEMGKDRRRLENIVKALARFFWFTIEFGLIREGEGYRACGSGLLSSYGELEHALESEDVERVPLALDRVIHTPFEIDHYQPLLMVMEGFDQLYEMIERLERRVRSGGLDFVTPGKPEIGETDLRSFSDSGVAAA